MSEVYALVKQAEDGLPEHVTLHGVTVSERIADTWTAGHERNYAPMFDCDYTPQLDPWVPEDEEDE